MSFRARRNDDYYNDSYRNLESVDDPRQYDEELQRYNRKDDEPEIYIVRQQFGYMSILFSVLQSLILGLMMWQCGIAPLNLNPMVGPYPDVSVDETLITN